MKQYRFVLVQIKNRYCQTAGKIVEFDSVWYDTKTAAFLSGYEKLSSGEVGPTEIGQKSLHVVLETRECDTEKPKQDPKCSGASIPAGVKRYNWTLIESKIFSDVATVLLEGGSRYLSRQHALEGGRLALEFHCENSERPYQTDLKIVVTEQKVV